MGVQIKKIQTGTGNPQPATVPAHVPPAQMPKTGK
jgi:hypothetical protein